MWMTVNPYIHMQFLLFILEVLKCFIFLNKYKLLEKKKN